MTIPNNYEINVAMPPTPKAQYGTHYCRIELGSCLEETAIEKFNTIKGFFPNDWVLDLHRITCCGHLVNVE